MKNFRFDRSPQVLQRWAGQYGTAILATGVAIWVRASLQPWLGNQCEFSLFYLSVLVTLWIAGTRPAIFAIVLGSIAAEHFFIAPLSSIYIHDVPDLVQLSIFIIVNVTATLLFSRLVRQRELAENCSDENRKLSETLRIADERKDEFLALLAHELRNPLAPIRTSLALLERRPDSPETVSRMCEVIGRQANHLVRITDDLLDVSRFSRGKVTLKIQRLDLRDPVYDAVEMTNDLIEDKHHTLQLLLPDEPVWVNGDRVRLAQLFANLLGNAAKYTPTAGRISLQVETLDESVSVAVTDNGIGFSPEQAERILAPFTQVDTSRTREYGGLGLGLTIVSRLVAMHEGKLETFSRGPGRGSRFTVSLPKAPTDSIPEDSDDSESSQRHASGFAHSDDDSFGCGRQLLIVEDNTDASNLLRELFELEGYSVEVASNGVEALQAAIAKQPDVVVCDIGLPGMDGYEIAQRLRRNAATRDARLIALTGWGSPTDQRLAVEAGFDLHLVKPIGFRELFQHVQDQMDAAGTPRQSDTRVARPAPRESETRTRSTASLPIG
jgi:signal transduction histidine kinase/DNA-binding NarL/FixJ family response regulator